MQPHEVPGSNLMKFKVADPLTAFPATAHDPAKRYGYTIIVHYPGGASNPLHSYFWHDPEEDNDPR